MTWVLVLLTGAYYGHNISTVPGYKSETACTEAGKQYEQRVKPEARTPSRTIWACIPGPH